MRHLTFPLLSPYFPLWGDKKDITFAPKEKGSWSLICSQFPAAIRNWDLLLLNPYERRGGIKGNRLKTKNKKNLEQSSFSRL